MTLGYELTADEDLRNNSKSITLNKSITTTPDDDISNKDNL